LENSGVDRKVKYRLPNNNQTDTNLDLYSFNLRFVMVLSLQESSANNEVSNSDKDINLFPLQYILSEMAKNDYCITTDNFKLFHSDKLRVNII
jgi:hypothetical protein